MGSDVDGYWISLEDDINVSKLDCGAGYIAMYIYKNHWTADFIGANFMVC